MKFFCVFSSIFILLTFEAGATTCLIESSSRFSGNVNLLVDYKIILSAVHLRDALARERTIDCDIEFDLKGFNSFVSLEIENQVIKEFQDRFRDQRSMLATCKQNSTQQAPSPTTSVGSSIAH